MYKGEVIDQSFKTGSKRIDMTEYAMILEPAGRRSPCREDESLLACARSSGIGVNSVCGGAGVCRGCRVRVLDGVVSEPTSREQEALTAEELAEGWRLACQTFPRGDCKLYIPPESMTALQRTQVEGDSLEIAPEPPVRSHLLSIEAPSGADLRADADRLLAGLNRQADSLCDRIDIDVLRELSPLLRKGNWSCRAVTRGNEVVAAGLPAGRLLGLAVDLGSTKIAAYLVDLENGKTIASQGAMNPQISYGEDIVSRIVGAIKNPEDALKMQRLAAGAINGLVAGMCRKAELEVCGVSEAVIVGNTAMHHLLLGLPAGQLALPPFVSAVNQPVDVKAREIGITIAPGAYVHMLPNIAGYVGGDHVAMLLATDAWRMKGSVLALDIGTNTEVSLVSEGTIASVSCASGPAFEGGHIRDGMRAARGAIERVQIIGDVVNFQTIEDAPPAGICGSGILDALAQLYQAGIIDGGGRMTASHPRLRTTGNQREFLLAGSGEKDGGTTVSVTQKDIRELQLAKAAIRTGIQVLLESCGRTETEIDKVIIAGAFGSYIDVGSAIAVGMLPALPLSRFVQVGNAAGQGARLALISRRKRDEAKMIAEMVHYIELAGAPRFNEMFVQASFLGKYRIVNGRREEI